jgi:hypothetical protein
MPKVKISEYSATANSNTDVASINIDEGCAPSGINNAIRAIMGHLKDFQQGPNGDPFNGPVNGTLGATTASTANVTTLTTSSTVTHNGGTINGVAYLNGAKVLTTGSALVFDGTVVNNTGAAPNFRSTITGGSYYTNLAADGIYASGTDLYLFAPASKFISFYAAGAEKMRLGAATGGVGALGIGYTSLTSVGDNGLAVLGNVGIGTSSPVYQTQIYGSGQTTAALTDSGNKGGSLLLNTPTVAGGDGGALLIGAGGAGAKPFAAIKGLLADGGGNTTGALAFSTRNATGDTSLTERMRLDSSGNLLVGITTAQTGIASDPAGTTLFGSTLGAAIFTRTSGSPLYVNNKASSGILVTFYCNNNAVGDISSTGTTTVYGTTSDYRLKTVIGPVADAGQRIDALQPVEYTWNSNGTRTRGFLAHEFQEVYASSVTGTKDAVDAEGKPVYQAMQASTSEVIADLVAEIQSLRKRITALEGA